jgi:methionine synthase II (cobalamin-independent)
MKQSDDRILTSHVGSLPRGPVLTDLLIRHEAGEAIDAAALAAEIDAAVAHVVDRQRAAGVDIGNDGEQPRVGFQTYVPARMDGFGGSSQRRRPPDYIEFPAFAAHMHDIPLAAVMPVLYQAHVGALAIEFANPRHQHELAALQLRKMPADMLLLPGVLDTTCNYVEHPELVAQRIEQAVAVVGDRSRIIAGTDCGFGTFAGYECVAEDVVWAKLAALRAGADIATQRLWGRR